MQLTLSLQLKVTISESRLRPHDRLPSQPAYCADVSRCTYFLLGRWVSAEAAADFAAALDLGSRRTAEAAVAAFLLVTSPPDLRVVIGFPFTDGIILTECLDGHRKYTHILYMSI